MSSTYNSITPSRLPSSAMPSSPRNLLLPLQHMLSFIALASRVSYLLLLLLLPLLLLSSCSRKADPEWSKFLPEQTVLVYWGDQDQDERLRMEIGELVGDPMLVRQVLSDSAAVEPLVTALVPESVDQLSTLWIYSTSSGLNQSLAKSGWISKGSYSISEGQIDLFEKNDSAIATSTIGDWTIVSTRSRTIEQALRAANRTISRLVIVNSPGFHINVSEIGRLVAPLTSPAYRADLARSFQGLGVVHLSMASDSINPAWTIQLPIKSSNSRLVSYLIAGSDGQNASFGVPPGMALSLVWNDPHGVRPYDSLRYVGQTGEAVRSAIASMSPHLSHEVAMYVSDASSQGVAYVRKANMAAVGSVFADLYQRGVLDGERDVFVGRDPAFAKAICSGLCDLNRYSIGLGEDGIVISSSETLVRRLMVGYGDVSSLDSLVPAGGEGADGVAGSYGWVDVASMIAAARANGWMSSDKPVPGILRRFATLAYSVHTGGGMMNLNLKLNKGSSASTLTDLVLAWQYPLRGDLLVAEPVVAVLNGKSTVLISTASGRVLALGSDGNLLFEVTTGTQEPVGGVEIYDWYANRSPVVFQAAGSAIYAWSPSGNLLPTFPFVIDSPISAPIVLTDVDGNAEPEILVATADERLHLINRDGRGVAGWPVYTDGNIVARPEASKSNGSWRVEITTENAVEIYDRLGQRISNRHHIGDHADKLDSLKNRGISGLFDGSAPMLYGQFPVVADIDGDGRKELIVVLDGQIRCYRLPSSRPDSLSAK